MERRYNAVEAAAAQRAYCDEHELPQFAPDTGWCSACGRNIYEPYEIRSGRETIRVGIDVETAGRKLITSCPHCRTTFCD